MDNFNTTMLYGPSGAGKTREIGALALYVYQKTGKTTRLISADGGGWGSIQDYVDAGLIEPINISNHRTPLTVLNRLARGDWFAANKWWSREEQGNGFDKVGMYAIEGCASVCNLLMQDQIEKGRKI